MLILGSQSPRRKEIFSSFSLPFEQISPDIDEGSIPFEGKPEGYALTVAEKKSEALLNRFPDRVIVTADTVVWHQGKALGKPRDEEEAFRMLSSLSGSRHQVITAVVVRKGEEAHAAVEKTNVEFFPLKEKEIRAYLRACHPCDKAGGYAIQENGGLVVKAINGSYDNIIGLPLQPLNQLLNRFGIDLWDYVSS